MKKLLLSIFAWASLFANAQQKPVQWSFDTKINAESRQQLVVKAIIAKGIKLLSANDIKGLDGVKTAFNFDTASRKKLAGTVVTDAKPISEKNAALGNVDIQYFTDSATWLQEVTVAKGDSFRIKGEISYYFLNGENAETFSEPFSKQFFYRESADKVLEDKTGGSAGSGKSSNRSLFAWMIGGIVLGLIGFLTPCVYSLVPVTVSLFIKRSKTARKGQMAALTYTFFIVAIYTVLGLLVYFFGGATKLNEISTSWQFNMFVFALFIIFGISFLGAFEISLPSSWATKLDSKSNIGSLSGLFFMALTFVVVSFSCTGNFVASALTANGLGTVFGLFGFGLGLALPFTLFAFFPSWLKELSKPGGWQNALKVCLGILELALALKFLSNADVQLGTYWLTRDIYLAIWIALFIFLAIYLLGAFRMKHDSDLPKNDWDKTYIPIPRFFFALLSLGFAVYLIPGLWGAPLNKISGLLPPYGTQEYTSAGISNATPATTKNFSVTPVKYYKDLIMNESAPAKKAGLVTFYDYEEAMAAAKEQGKPLMLDFTGIVCPNCREFENRVWTQPEVMDRMKNKFVVASLFEDFTQELPDADKRPSALLGQNLMTVGDKFKELSLKLTGGVSQPNYVFLNLDGSKIVDKGYGYDDIQKNGVGDFVKHMDLVLEKFKH
jgi:thiol:disulfide interchange protein DsbD